MNTLDFCRKKVVVFEGRILKTNRLKSDLG